MKHFIEEKKAQKIFDILNLFFKDEFSRPNLKKKMDLTIDSNELDINILKKTILDCKSADIINFSFENDWLANSYKRRLQIIKQTIEYGNSLILTFLISTFPEFEKELKELKNNPVFIEFMNVKYSELKYIYQNFKITTIVINDIEYKGILIEKRDKKEVLRFSELTFEINTMLSDISPIFKDFVLKDNDLYKKYKAFFEEEKSISYGLESKKNTITQQEKEISNLDNELKKEIKLYNKKRIKKFHKKTIFKKICCFFNI